MKRLSKMIPKSALRQWIGVACAVVAAVRVCADDAVWKQTATGTYDWTNVVNWLPANTFPNGAGQAAYMTNDIVGAQTIQLRTNVKVGTLNVGDAVASGGNYGTTINNKSGETYTLTFDSGVASNAATLSTGNSGIPKSSLSVPMTLASDLRVKMVGTDSMNSPYLSLNGMMVMNGHTLTFSDGVSGQTRVTLDDGADFSGAGTVIYNAQAGVSVIGGKAFGGTLIANQPFSLVGGGFTNAAECVVNGWVSNSTTRIGGSLDVGNNASQTNNPGQRLTKRRITLNGGVLSANGQAATVGTANDWQKGLEVVHNMVDVLDFRSGYNYVSVKRNTTTAGTWVEAGTVLRSRGATALLYTIDNTNALFRADNGTNLLIGAGGAANSTTMGIVPWMDVTPLNGALSPNGFATYETVTGFRSLDLVTEYTNSLTAGASQNVSLTTAPAALSTNATVNALRLQGQYTYNLGTGRTLTVASGGLFLERQTLGASGDATAGTVNFGASEGVVSVYGTYSATIGAAITGTGGLTKASTGELVLTGANSYSGMNHVSGGTLRVGDGTNGSSLGSGNVEVHAGATVRISCSNAVADSATVKLHNLGPDLYAGRLHLDAGMNETVKYLYRGNVGLPAGTYGSSASSATHTNDVYFAGAGVLTVGGSANALRPGTMIRIL